MTLWVHGGGWIEGTDSTYRLILPKFTEWGIRLYTAIYRLIPAATMADEVYDVADQIDRVRRTSLAPFIVAANSAGAHLAATAVLRADDNKPTCLVLLDPVGLDLPKLLTDQPSLQITLGLTPEQALAFSPTALADSHDRTQVFVAASDFDALSRQWDTLETGRNFVDALHEHGITAEFHYYPHVGHLEFVTAFSNPGSVWAEDVHKFLQSCAASTAIK